MKWLLFILIIASLLVPLMIGYSYEEMNLAQENLPPSLQHLFGTDELGRDLLTRVFIGARISLLIGSAAAAVDLIIGIIWGSIAAYFGGAIDRFMMRIADILYSLPYLLIVIALVVVLGSGIASLIFAMASIGWIPMARIVRGLLLSLISKPFVQASKIMGGGPYWIISRHLLPNAFGPLLTALTFTIPYAIFVEAFLSFMGLGVGAPLASLGSLARDGLPGMVLYPWRIVFPSLILFLFLFCLNRIGDQLELRYASA